MSNELQLAIIGLIASALMSYIGATSSWKQIFVVIVIWLLGVYLGTYYDWTTTGMVLR